MFERGIGYVVANRREPPKTHHRPGVELRVGFVLARHFTLSAFSLFVDTLRLASDVDDRSGRLLCDWDVISSTPHMIRSSSGIQVSPTTRLGNPERFDYIAVIGGLLDVEEQLDRETIAFLHEASRRRTRIIGVCTGSFILAGSDLLRNRQACVSWLHHSEFKARFPDVRLTSQRLFIEDGGIITCAGGSAVLPVHFDDRIKAALLCMEQHLDERIGIDEVALSVSLSRRQLERIFHNKTGISPAAAYEQIRLKKALLLIERTSKSLIEIALDVGFASSSHFCRRFRARFGITPNAHRLKSQIPRSLKLEKLR